MAPYNHFPCIFSTLLFTTLFFFHAPQLATGAGGGSMAQQCSAALQQVTSCLSYATGKVADPTKECCTAVSSMKEKQPVCLCYLLEQTHNGSDQIKSLGIQEAKLLQLPSSCKLSNASISDCPKFLGISATSPAAAIFTNTSSSASPTTPSSSSSSSSTPDANSARSKHGVIDINFLIGVTVATFLFAFKDCRY